MNKALQNKVSFMQGALPKIKSNRQLLAALVFACLLAAISPKRSSAAFFQVQQDTSLTIRGRVLDTKEPPQSLPGTSIKVKGKPTGVSTDADGNFMIKAAKGDVLVFSMVGFDPQEYTVTRTVSSLSIALKESAGALNEVVVTGVTEQQRKHIASSVASLNISSNVVGKPITQLSQALQGGVTGIQVAQRSGIPGRDEAQILVRGMGTLGNSNPLVLVDGIPMDMNDIDPFTVESITVLKDAAAGASYGSRAANGVIVVTTKRGTPGTVAVTYDGYYGVQNPAALPNTVDAALYMCMANEAKANSGLTTVFTADAIAKTASGEDPIRYPNTNWLDMLINRAAPITNHSLSISGGNNLARFAITGNYMIQEGMTPIADGERFNLRANTTITVSDKFIVGLDLLGIRSTRREPQKISNAVYGGNRLLEDMYRVPPFVMSRYPDRDGFRFYQSYIGLGNPLAIVEENGYRSFREDVTSINLQPKWTVFPGFNLKGQFSYRVNSLHNTEFSNGFLFLDYFTNNIVTPTWPSLRTSSVGRNTYFFLSGSADYTYNRNDHNLLALAGYSQELSAEGDWNQWAILSGYTKINYAYKDKYLVELSGRIDGSSRFGSSNKYGFFPSVAVGWNVHKESFLQGIKVINNLKLRTSYGQLGNQNIGLYQYQSPIRTADGLETRFGNPDITWEKVNMLDIGMDLGLFKNSKLEITADYYRKLTKDMLMNPQVSLVGGMTLPGSPTVPTYPPVNSGEVLNTGFELAVNYNERVSKSINVSIRPGLTWNENKLMKLPGGPYQVNGTTTEWLRKIDAVGSQIKSYYGYRTDGLLQASDFDQAGNPHLPVISATAKEGDIKYLDVDGDGTITESDMTVLANSMPNLNYFANLGFTFKNFDFEVLLQGTGKSAAALSGMWAMPLDDSFDGGVPTTFYAENYWSPERPNARFPRLRAQPGINKVSSDFWIDNAAYLRFKFIQMGYNFNGQKIKSLGIKGIRVYLNAQNPFTISNISMGDPESRGNQYTYPILSTYTVGLNVRL